MTNLSGDKINRVLELEKENEKLKEKIELLESENRHLSDELSIAVKLKYHLMPNVYPAFPDISDIDIFADSIHIEQLGGDFYDFFRIDADHIGIVIADIFDGGVAAALYMVAFKMYLTSQVSMDDSVSDRIESVNNYLCWKNDDNLSLSAWFGVYEVSSAAITAVNAGHESPVIIKADGSVVYPKEKVSYLLGVIENMQYEEYKFYLDEGDRLFLYTDGVINSTNLQDQEYGTERLVKAFSQSPDAGAEMTVGIAEKDFSDFLGGSPLSEDASFLCLRRGGAKF